MDRQQISGFYKGALWFCVLLLACLSDTDPFDETIAVKNFDLITRIRAGWRGAEQAVLGSPVNFTFSWADIVCSAEEP